MRRAAPAVLMAWASACGVAHAGYFECQLGADGSRRIVQQDLAERFPALVGECRPVQMPARPATPQAEEDAEEAGEVGAARTAVRVIVAHQAAAAAAWHAPSAWNQLIAWSAGRHEVDPRLVQAVIQVESAYEPAARSPKGAIGLMQLMPATAERYGAPSAEALLDPRVNVDVGVRYLRALLDRFDQRTDLALAAYNAGEGAVVRHGYQVPPYRETQDYVRKVRGLYEGLE
jgi:soluble lytic murein transglycosylase-like protein